MNLEHGKDSSTSNYLKIYTLGDFQVRRGGEVLSATVHRSSRLWSLFNYLVINRPRNIASDELLESIWIESDKMKNPEQALRTSIYRLRQLLETSSRVPQIILSSQGCYRWNNDKSWLDCEEFERKSILGEKLAGSDPDRASDTLKEALLLYQGAYLSGFRDAPWIEPYRNYYRRMYVEGVLRLIDLLKAKRQFAVIIKICERAALLEPFEEELHLSLIEALLEEGKNGLARTHYEYVTSLYYREMGVKPSPAMRSIYRRMMLNHEAVERDLNMITAQLKERDSMDGAFQCNTDIFRYLYKLEERKMRRSGHPAILVLFTLDSPEFNMPDPKILAAAMQLLNEILLHNLRQGDVICRWNEAQHLALLPELNHEQIGKVVQRIEQKFLKQSKSCNLDRFILHAVPLPLSPIPNN